jgi:hypothetical protein
MAKWSYVFLLDCEKVRLSSSLLWHFRDFPAALSISQAAGITEAHARYRSFDLSPTGMFGPDLPNLS